MHNPVRDKPDYNEQEWSVKDKANTLLDNVTASFVRDYRSGIFVEALDENAMDDCLIEYGAQSLLNDVRSAQIIAKRVNAEVTRIKRAKIAARDSLCVRLAKSFGNAIRDGRIAKREYFTRNQAKEFLCGALGTVDSHLLAEFAIAHNINNGDCGRIEIDAGKVRLLPVVAGMNDVKVFIETQTNSPVQEELAADGSMFFLPGEENSQALWNILRQMKKHLPQYEGEVMDEETSNQHIHVYETASIL